METQPTTRPLRTITNDDLWAAIRGLGLYRRTRDELLQLIADHKPLTAVGRDAFASAVIVEAARQVLVTKPREC